MHGQPLQRGLCVTVARQRARRASCVAGQQVTRHKEDRPCGEWDASHPSRFWDSAQAWSDGAQGEEKDREPRSFPLPKHRVTEG